MDLPEFVTVVEELRYAQKLYAQTLSPVVAERQRRAELAVDRAIQQIRTGQRDDEQGKLF